MASIPAVKGTVVALYATGSATIEATAADIAKYKNAGAGVILIDQTASLSVFAAGLADVADIENGAGTYGAAADAVLARQAKGWQSTFYISQSSYEALIAEFSSQVDASLVLFGIANWSDSLAAAEAALTANAHWAYVQYGDPGSNPDTLVPGTNVTLKQSNADIDVAQESWLSQFLPDPPPVPNPQPIPVGLSASPYHAIDIAWGVVATASRGYDVQITDSTGTKEVFRSSVAGTHLLGVALPKGTYLWRVSANAAGGKSDSPWSKTATFTLRS